MMMIFYYAFLGYLLGAFVSWNVNPGEWPIELRFGVSIISIFILILNISGIENALRKASADHRASMRPPEPPPPYPD